MITFCIQCHNFERRLCWMLSSLVEQTVKDFAIDVAFIARTSRLNARAVVEFFQAQGLEIVAREYTDFQYFERRGLTRNDQLRQCSTPWIWFCDSDHVYHPHYIERILPELEKHSDEDKILTAGRMSTPPTQTSQLVDAAIVSDPVCIDNTFQQADHLEPKARRRACGAGHTQIVRSDGDHNRIYVDESRCRDWPWSTRFQKAKSDIQFRRRCGGAIKLPAWFTLNQIHLNHPRDNEVGRHLEDQR